MAEQQGQEVVSQPAFQELNPHQAVAELTAMIEKEEAQPRDEKGKFAKPATEEAQPATEATEETEEAPALEEQQPETKAETRRLKLKYKGEEKEVDEAEAVELAQKGYDYTQKSQALAKEREELQARIKSDVEANRKQYEQQLEVYRQSVLKLADPDVVNADLDKLAQEDPARAFQISLKRQALIGSLQAINGEQQRIAQQREVESRTAQQKQRQEALETIQRDIPNWNQEVYGNLLKTAVNNGFTQDEANAITDPKVVKLLNKARQWDEYVAAKPKTLDKRVAAVPKVQKPGTTEKSDPNAEKLKAGMAQLTKSGNREDAVGLISQMIQSGRL